MTPAPPRTRVVVAGRRLFLDRGYVDTTIGAIAAEAGVALRTIYSGYGSKVGVLAAVQDAAVAGDDEPVPLLERGWVRELGSLPRAEALRRVVENFAAGTERAAPIVEVIQAAASDAGVRELLDVLHTQRVETCRGVALLLSDSRAEHLADQLYALLGVESYLLLVRRRGWTRDAWSAWAERCLAAELARNLGAGVVV